MKKNQDEDYIEKFLTLCVEFSETYKKVEEKYKVYFLKVNECDKASSDLLHLLELKPLTTSGKAKWATQMSVIRKDRRYFKDKAEALEDIVEKFKSWGQSFDGCMNKLGNIAGNARQKYRNREGRTYTPRVIKDAVINPKK